MLCKLVFNTVVVVSLSACMSVDPDPASGGFFNGISGIASNGYQERIDVLEQELATVQRQISAQKGERAQLMRREKELQQQISKLKRQVGGENGVDT